MQRGGEGEFAQRIGPEFVARVQQAGEVAPVSRRDERRLPARVVRRDHLDPRRQVGLRPGEQVADRRGVLRLDEDRGPPLRIGLPPQRLERPQQPVGHELGRVADDEVQRGAATEVPQHALDQVGLRPCHAAADRRALVGLVRLLHRQVEPDEVLLPVLGADHELDLMRSVFQHAGRTVERVAAAQRVLPLGEGEPDILARQPVMRVPQPLAVEQDFDSLDPRARQNPALDRQPAGDRVGHGAVADRGTVEFEPEHLRVGFHAGRHGSGRDRFGRTDRNHEVFLMRVVQPVADDDAQRVVPLLQVGEGLGEAVAGVARHRDGREFLAHVRPRMARFGLADQRPVDQDLDMRDPDRRDGPAIDRQHTVAADHRLVAIGLDGAAWIRRRLGRMVRRAGLPGGEQVAGIHPEHLGRRRLGRPFGRFGGPDALERQHDVAGEAAEADDLHPHLLGLAVGGAQRSGEGEAGAARVRVVRVHRADIPAFQSDLGAADPAIAHEGLDRHDPRPSDRPAMQGQRAAKVERGTLDEEDDRRVQPGHRPGRGQRSRHHVAGRHGRGVHHDPEPDGMRPRLGGARLQAAADHTERHVGREGEGELEGLLRHQRPVREPHHGSLVGLAHLHPAHVDVVALEHEFLDALSGDAPAHREVESAIHEPARDHRLEVDQHGRFGRGLGARWLGGRRGLGRCRGAARA